MTMTLTDPNTAEPTLDNDDIPTIVDAETNDEALLGDVHATITLAAGYLRYGDTTDLDDAVSAAAHAITGGHPTMGYDLAIYHATTDDNPWARLVHSRATTAILDVQTRGYTTHLDLTEAAQAIRNIDVLVEAHDYVTAA